MAQLPMSEERRICGRRDVRPREQGFPALNEIKYVISPEVQQKDRDLGSELGYADYLGALECYRFEDLHRPEVLNARKTMVSSGYRPAKGTRPL
jgi:hypothetical protein